MKITVAIKPCCFWIHLSPLQSELTDASISLHHSGDYGAHTLMAGSEQARNKDLQIPAM